MMAKGYYVVNKLSSIVNLRHVIMYLPESLHSFHNASATTEKDGVVPFLDEDGIFAYLF